MPRDTRTYITVHDGMPENPKVEVLSDGAFRAMVEMWCWCSRNKTDGRIPSAVWTKRVPPKVRKELLRDLIVTDGEDFLVHDYLEHQRSAAEIAELREKRATAGKKGGQAKANGVANAKANAKQPASDLSSKPLAETDIETTNQVSSSPESLAASEMCELLANLIEANGSLRPKITQAWLDEARRLLTKDKREQAKAENLIRWSQEDSFWRKNILSMPTFRKQYDKIRLAAVEAWEKNKTGVNPNGGIDPDAILGPDHWAPGAVPDGLTLEEELEWKREQRAQHAAERLELARRKINAA